MRARAPPFDSDASDARRRRAQTTLDFAVGMSIFLLTIAFVISFTPNLIQPFSDSGTENTIVANRAASQLVEGSLVDPNEPYVLDKGCTMAFFWPENVDGDDNNNLGLNETRNNNLQSYDDVENQPFWNSDCNFDPDASLYERLGIAGIADDGSVDQSLSPGLEIEIRGDNNTDGVTKLLCVDANNRSDTTKAEVVDPIIDADDSIGGPCDVSGDDQDIPFQAGEEPPEDSNSVVVSRRIVTIDGIRSTVLVKVW